MSNFDTKTGVIAILAILLIGSLGYNYMLLSKPKSEEPTEPTGPTLTPLTDTESLNIAMDLSIIVSLDPARAYEGTAILMDNQCFDKLVDFVPPDYTTVVPEIAEDWEVATDKKTWKFYIREGVTFSNGDPVDAEAVAYSLKRVIQLGQEASWMLEQFVSSPEHITVIDPYTVQVVLDEPVAPSFFLSTLSCTTATVVNPNVLEEHAEDDDMGSDWMTMNGGSMGTGSGPYILESFERESKIVMTANENYWRGEPTIKKIVIQHVAEPEVQRLMLEKGDVDIAWGLYAEIIQDLEGTQGIRIYRTNSWGVNYVGMNVGVEPLDDNNVRKAIRYAIDYEGIISEILAGAAVKAQTVIPYGFLGFNPALPYYRDVNKAKTLLEDAGYPEGFSIEMAVPAGTYPQLDIAAKLKSDLADIGVDVQINQITSATMYERYRAQGLQLVLAGWGSDYPDPDCNARAFGDHRMGQLAYRNMWLDDYVADLCDEAAVESDLAEREGLYTEITDYILEDGPFAVLYQPLVQRAIRTWVEGFIVSPSSYTQDFYGVYKDPVYEETS
ncbi:MAG: ABC transporter substrate-binding protein [Candidatus Bathyarchaeia archaeon]